MSEGMAENITRRKFSGDLCDHHDGRPIVWNGHLCEGANLVAPVGRAFVLWTKCGKHDVPANAAYVGTRDDVVCSDCGALAEREKTR